MPSPAWLGQLDRRSVARRQRIRCCWRWIGAVVTMRSSSDVTPVVTWSCRTPRFLVGTLDCASGTALGYFRISNRRTAPPSTASGLDAASCALAIISRSATSSCRSIENNRIRLRIGRLATALDWTTQLRSLPVALAVIALTRPGIDLSWTPWIMVPGQIALTLTPWRGSRRPRRQAPRSRCSPLPPRQDQAASCSTTRLTRRVDAQENPVGNAEKTRSRR